MKPRGRITFKAALYTMVKHWKVVLVMLCLGLVISVGFVIATGKKAVGENKSASTIDLDLLVKNKQLDDIEGYKAYIENSAYMNLDSNNLHVHYLYYDISWKEQGLQSADYEKKNATLFRTMSLYYPSDDFAKEIISFKGEYKDNDLYEVVSASRSGNTYSFMIAYTDDYYVKDLCSVIDTTLKKKSSEWYSLAGEFEFTRGPETDKTIDGVTGGYKDNQDKKRAALAKMQTAVTNNVPASAATAKDTKDTSLVVKIFTVIVIALVWSVLSSIAMLLFEKKFNSANDVSDLIGQDVICIVNNSQESGLDKKYYKNNDRYHNPEFYLSILNKNMINEGIKKAYLYNSSECNLADVNSKVSEIVSGVEMKYVPYENVNDSILNVQENEGVIILVKGGETEKKAFLKMAEHMKDVNVRCLGVIFAV